MEIKVGMYARIQWGNGEQTISKCTNKVDMGDTQYSKNDFYIHTDKRGEVIYKSMIVKASHNIIDLIEVGDYVNGHQVYDDFRADTDDYGNNFIEIGIESDRFLNHYIREDEIKTIVTKEQFENMSYKIER